MMNQYLPIIMIAGAAALYHLSSKALGIGQMNPWAVLALTYLLCSLATAVLAFVLPGTAALRASDFRAVLPGAAMLGLACVGIEGGYLLAYGSGWEVTKLFSITSVTSTIAIFSVGLLFFKEPISLSSIVGMGIVLLGIGVIHWK